MKNREPLQGVSSQGIGKVRTPTGVEARAVIGGPAMKSLIGWAMIVLATCVAGDASGAEPQAVIRLGMIGLDTSHVVEFTKYLNNPDNNTGCRVVAAYPGGSPDMPVSANRVKGFTDQLRQDHGVEIVDSIEELCRRVDGILLESVDGRPHLEQVKPVLAAKKPVFIDKPAAASLEDVIEIFRLAKEAGVPCWSSSDCRYSPAVIEVNKGKVGDVIGCLAYGPCSSAPYHPDLYWYGVHTAETLFAIMGPGCVSVTRAASPDTDVVVGNWSDGRVGIFRGTRKGKGDGGFLVFGSKEIYQGAWGDYDGLLEEMVQFFKSGEPPVPAEETIEIFAFMSAADASKDRGGVPVRLEEVIERARSPKPAQASERQDKLRIVFFGAHCDDNEVGAGGLMAMLAEAGHEVISAYGTTFRGGRMIEGEPEDSVRRRESTAACQILGATPKFFPYAHESLYADVSTIEAVGRWLEEVRPDIVVTHWPMDTHPNHQVVSSLVWHNYNHGGRIWGQGPESAAESKQKLSWNLYFYEVNTFTTPEDLETLAFQPQLYLNIERVRDKKKQATDCFKSQAHYNLWDVQDHMHVQRGHQCGVQHAEAYFLVEAKEGCPLLPVPFIHRK